MYEKLKLEDLSKKVPGGTDPAFIYEVTDENGISIKSISNVLVLDKTKSRVFLDVLKTYDIDECDLCVFHNRTKLCNNVKCGRYYYISGDLMDIKSIYDEVVNEYNHSMISNYLTKLDAVKKICNRDFCIYYDECKENENSNLDIDSCIIKYLFD